MPPDKAPFTARSLTHCSKKSQGFDFHPQLFAGSSDIPLLIGRNVSTRLVLGVATKFRDRDAAATEFRACREKQQELGRTYFKAQSMKQLISVWKFFVVIVHLVGQH